MAEIGPSPKQGCTKDNASDLDKESDDEDADSFCHGPVRGNCRATPTDAERRTEFCQPLHRRKNNRKGKENPMHNVS